MPVKKLLIFPFNGNGLEALDCIDDTTFDFIGFIDDDLQKLKQDSRYSVFGRSVLQEHSDAFVLAVPGGPQSFSRRSEFIMSLGIPAGRMATVIHPSAKIGKHVTIGINCLIMAGVVLTSNAIIGDHVCILPNTVIHHDAVIKDFTLVGSNVSVAGGTKIGRNCYIGTGSNLINGIKIGDNSLIGLGSNVLKDVPSNSRIAGNPARPLKDKADI